MISQKIKNSHKHSAILLNLVIRNGYLNCLNIKHAGFIFNISQKGNQVVTFLQITLMIYCIKDVWFSLTVFAVIPFIILLRMLAKYSYVL
ncbi:hypothetical protein D478_15305 [Brevibacillus agri BAB-2500]|nr:hypothetical protein D478_15305 [Brevibacillus agri BAB-2500]